MEQTMIKTENLSKRFGSFALQDIHFELPAGYICGLIGENGAGKTTLLNILSGLYEYDGTVYLEGKEYRANQMELQQEIGFVFHEEWFDDWDSLIANSRHYGKYYKHYDETLLKEYLKRFRLDGKNFDQTFREEFHHILREFTEDGTKSVILSTHITSDVDRFADYLLFLKEGRQLLYGDIESVRDAYRMVAGERYALKAFGGQLVYMEETPVGCSALVKHDHAEYDRALKVWEPNTEELMYYLAKGAEHGRSNQV